MLAALTLDLRYALRRLLGRPAFSAVVVGSLALGIGANAVIFSVARALLWRGAPYPDPHRVVLVWFTPPNDPGARILATDGNCAALRLSVRSFEHIGCVLPDRTTTLAALDDASERGTEAMRVSGQEFTAGVAEALGIAPALGRWFTFDEEQRAEPVAIISHALWQRRFGGAGDILGRGVRLRNDGLADEVVTIVGVARRDFLFLDTRVDYWIPIPVRPGGHGGTARRFVVVGRLKSGVALHQAQWELNAVAARLAADAPFTNKGWGIRAEPIRQTLRQAIGRPVLILQGVVLAVLLIACGNVAGLLLAEGVARRGEMAVRAALGASRGRIVRQWLAESALTSMAGAAAGLGLTWVGLRLLSSSFAAALPGGAEVALDGWVLFFTVALAVLTALVFGVSPALHATCHDAAGVSTGSARLATATGPAQRLRSLFVVGQLSLAVALSIGAGLMVKSLVRLHAVDVGVNPDGLTTFQVQLDGRRYIRHTGRSTPSGAAETELMPRLFSSAEHIRERLAGMPGVQSVSAMAATAPLSGAARRYGFAAPRSSAALEQPIADWFAVLPAYFTTLRVAILQGRDFTASDTASGIPVMVINKSLADELWPGEDPIGQTVQMNLFNDPPRQVVGVVADVQQRGASRGRPRQVYVPFAQVRSLQSGVVAQGLQLFTFVVRLDHGATPVPFREIVWEADPHVPVTNVRPLQLYVDDQLRDVRQYAVMLGVFGVVAIGLAVLGAYGLMAHAVTLRLREIGIRMALGASHRRILWLVLRRGLGVSAAGVAVGLLLGLTFTNVLASYLWEVTPTDRLTFTVVPALVAAVSLVACHRAARRALQIDPANVIRQE